MKLVNDKFILPKNYTYFNNYLDKYFVVVNKNILNIYNKNSERIFTTVFKDFITSCFNHKGTELAIIQNGALILISLENLSVTYTLKDKNFELRTKKELENVIYINNHNDEYIIEEDEVIHKIEFTNDDTKIVILKNTALILFNFIDKTMKISNKVTYFVDFIINSTDNKCILLEKYITDTHIIDLSTLRVIDDLSYVFYKKPIFTNDGNYIIICQSPKILIIELNNYKVVKEINYCKSLGSVGFVSPIFDISLDKDLLLVANTEGLELSPHIINLKTNEIIKYFELPKDRYWTSLVPKKLEFNFDNKYILVLYDEGYGYVIFNVWSIPKN